MPGDTTLYVYCSLLHATNDTQVGLLFCNLKVKKSLELGEYLHDSVSESTRKNKLNTIMIIMTQVSSHT